MPVTARSTQQDKKTENATKNTKALSCDWIFRSILGRRGTSPARRCAAAAARATCRTDQQQPEGQKCRKNHVGKNAKVGLEALFERIAIRNRNTMLAKLIAARIAPSRLTTLCISPGELLLLASRLEGRSASMLTPQFQ